MNSSLSSLVAEVYLLTNREDLEGETILAVRAATLKAHGSDDYIFDLQENSIQFDTSDYFQSLDIKSVFPLWRKARYLRIYDNTQYTGGPSDFVRYVEPEKVVDEFGANRTNIFYQAGSALQIRTANAAQYFLIGYYKNPDVTLEGYDSWIADSMFRMAIVYEAAAIIFKTIGLDDQTVTYRGMVAEQLRLLTQNAITGIGS
jgi:hypothetical protein